MFLICLSRISTTYLVAIHSLLPILPRFSTIVLPTPLHVPPILHLSCPVCVIWLFLVMRPALECGQHPKSHTIKENWLYLHQQQLNCNSSSDDCRLCYALHFLSPMMGWALVIHMSLSHLYSCKQPIFLWVTTLKVVVLQSWTLVVSILVLYQWVPYLGLIDVYSCFSRNNIKIQIGYILPNCDFLWWSMSAAKRSFFGERWELDLSVGIRTCI